MNPSIEFHLKCLLLLQELKSLLDLSRNMSVYRNLLKNELVVPPIVSCPNAMTQVDALIVEFRFPCFPCV